MTYLLGQLGVLPFIALMVFMARRTGLKPVDHTNNLSLTRTRATLETVWLLAYMFVTMGLGMAFNLHTHIHFGAFADGTQSIFGWAPLFGGVNFVANTAWSFWLLAAAVVLWRHGSTRRTAKERGR